MHIPWDIEAEAMTLRYFRQYYIVMLMCIFFSDVHISKFVDSYGHSPPRHFGGIQARENATIEDSTAFTFKLHLALIFQVFDYWLLKDAGYFQPKVGCRES
jgi:hypothetical protein